MNLELWASRLSAGVGLGPVAFGIAYMGGLVAGLGPCVLPMLPAVFGYVTGTVAEQHDQRPIVRGLILSATFVAGMSLVFAAIGALAGTLGKALLLGAWAYYVAAALCGLIGLQMLGVIDLRVDQLNRLLPAKRPERRGLLGALLFGMLFGSVASPCSTPILAAISAIAATTQSALWGALLLFVYGLGKGTPLLLLGAASGSLALMKSISKVTPLLTKAGGVAIIGAGAYLVWLA